MSIEPSNGFPASAATSAGPVTGNVTVVTPGVTIDDEYIDRVDLDFVLGKIINAANDCSYSTGSTRIILTKGDFSVGEQFKILVKSTDCKDPLFTWSRSDTSTFADGSFRKVYGTLNSSGNYEDTIPSDITDSCKNYSLKVDCGCSTTASKYVVFCSPKRS